MKRFIKPYRMVFLFIFTLMLAIGFLTAYSLLTPTVSYQGRLTNAAGQPLNGTYSFTFSLFQTGIGGTSVYSSSKTISVVDGLFDTTVALSDMSSAIRPEWLTQPLFLEVAINGEILTPRQQLLGSPYAITLMTGAVISSTLSTSPGTMIDAVLTVDNKAETSSLPALRVSGQGGMELVGRSPSSDGPDHCGAIYGLQSYLHSDLRLATNDDLYIDLDNENNSAGVFRIRNGTKQDVCTVNESGDLVCIGTKSAMVSIQNQTRKMYAVESPEVWFEDFGSGTLTQGSGWIPIDPLFAATVDLKDYHVFVTPLGDCRGLYVTKKSADSFEVHELGNGKTNIRFDYRLIAKRRGYESDRLEPVHG